MSSFSENFVSFHEFFQLRKKQKSLGAGTMHLITGQLKHWLPSKMLALNYSVFAIVFVSHGKWLAGRPGTTILLQQYQSDGEMLDQVYFSCKCLC